MMLADSEWFAFDRRHSVGKLAIFYASPHKRTERENLDSLFCVRLGKRPRSIVGVGRIQAQLIMDQDTVWAEYGSALGAHTEREWRAQAAAVLENSRRTYGGRILAIELIDFQPFPEPVSPDAVGLTDTGWSDKKEAGAEATARLLELLGGKSQKRHPTDSPNIAQLKRQLDELQSGGTPENPEVLRKIHRVLKTYERPSRITRYVKRTRGATCQLCGELGFKMRNRERYCEVHHLFHLSKNPPPKCLAPEFLVVLCGTCHRRMHYADVGEPVRDRAGWRVRVDDREYLFRVESAAPNQALQMAE
jgi:5-methylcytosine-specific restriction endonuclease McrA